VVLSSTVRDERSITGHVVVQFTAGRARLDTIWLKLVCGHFEHVGRCIRLKDFVELKNVK
jgi:hypothetical protein